MNGSGFGRRVLRFLLPAALLVAFASIAVPALGTTWAPGPLQRTLNDPKACNNGGSCVTGGQFPDGPPSFAMSANGTTHYWYAAWVSDRPPADETQGLVPYGSNCTTSGNPNNSASVTAASYVTTTRTLSAYSVADQTQNLYGGPGTGGSVDITEVGTTATATLAAPFPAGFVLNVGDTVVIAGTDNAGYNGTFTVTGVTSSTVFTFTAAASQPDATGGTVTIHAATFTTTAAHGLDTNSIVNVTGTTPAGYSGTWNVENVPSSTSFVANISTGSLASGTAGSTNEWKATFTSSASNKMAAGSPVTVTGFTGGSAGYNGSWTVKSQTSTTFLADLNNAPGANPATGSGSVTVPPYCSGIYFTRSSDGGTTWSTAVALSDPATHADRYSIAAAGNYVYAIWTTTVGYYSQMCTDSPRVLYFTESSDYGATWSSPYQQRISTTNGRVDYPSIAAGPLNAAPPTGRGSVYVTYTQTPGGGTPGTNAEQHVAISTDSGGTWTDHVVGFTDSVFDNGVGKGAPSCPGVTWTPPSVEGNAGAAAIAGDGTNVGVMFYKNDTGKTIAKISTDNGSTWSTGCPSTNCTQVLTKSGGKGSIGKVSTVACASGGTAYGYGACGLSNGSVASDWVNHRLGFIWVDDTCLAGITGWPYNCATGSNVAPGVYYKGWSASGGWGPWVLVSCFQKTNSASPNACSGVGASSAVSAQWDGYSPSLAFFGTTGVAAAWTGCDVGAGQGAPCDGTKKDPGTQILYKESGNGGAVWGGDWGTVGSGSPGEFRIIANDAPGTCTNCGALGVTWASTQSKINQYPTLVFDKPGASYPTYNNNIACAQTGGAGETGCEHIVYFLGRNTGYTIYRMFLEIGTN